MVYVLSKEGEPLMPTKRHGKVRRLLKSGDAKVVRRKPFTIQLQYESTSYIQPVILGVDSGYQKVGLSAVTDKEELFSAEVNLLKGISERLKERSDYRRQRRKRKRYRKPRFNNRKREESWLAPSIQHKLDTHYKLINLAKEILPVTHTIVEVANFDIQKIKKPDIKEKEYQQGEQHDYWNLREYILHRDNHTCQNPNCENKSANKILEVHHVGYWKGDYSNRPSNLATLCDKCHIPKNHRKTGFLYRWEPKLNNFKPETFMSMVRWRLVNALNCEHTYGHTTKSKRLSFDLEKSHINDAFVIAGGVMQKRSNAFEINQYRRNNRSLEKFYDAQYIDIRNNKKKSGQELFSGRRTRNKELNGENLHKYRGNKISKGKRSIRKQRYFYQPNDLIKLNNKIYTVKGTHCKGSRVILKENNRSVSVNKLEPFMFCKGLIAS